MKISKIVLTLLGCLFLLASFTACAQLKKPENGNALPNSEKRYMRGHNIPGKLYWAGSVQDKKVALTFDDGPEAVWTPKVLEILKEKEVKATFFVIGQLAQKYPEMLKRIDSEGHIIGDHTFSHADLKKLDTQQVEQEIEKCAVAIKELTGKNPRLVRPPFGFHNAAVDQVIYSKNRIIVLWSLDTEDWQGLDAATVTSRILPKIENGYIILQHDGVNPKLGGSIQALPAIIDGLKEQGFTFVTIPELLDLEAYQ